jgi:hypothetical protein
MGFFNELITNVECSNCGNSCEARIQFKFGDTSQLEYKIGDKLAWGGNDVGRPNIKKVKVYGTLPDNECPICHYSNDEFDIYLEMDVLVKVCKMKDIREYLGTETGYKTLVE